jgi:hemerythrin-like domain-containing protein
MNPTENLTREHKDINELLNIMNKIADQIRSNKVFYTNDVEDILDFLLVFIENFHHQKEEIFYPVLVSAGIPEEPESISIMLYEHVLSRNYLNEISCCVQNCKIGNDFSGELLADSLMKYVTLLKGHIKKEEKLIFPLADKQLSEEKQNEIYKKFEDIDKAVVGQRNHDHYHKMLQGLKFKYAE